MCNMNDASQGIMIGRSEDTWVWSGSQRSCLALGPTRSGKTTSLIIPNVLCAPGSVVVTSTKQDVLEATHHVRNRAGRCYLFDPLETVNAPPAIERITWSPLQISRFWDGALIASSAMVMTSQSGRAGHEDHWSERAGALLACFLHAAALEDLSMSTVASWVDCRQPADALAILDHHHGSHPATDLLRGIMKTDARELSGIYSTTSGTLGVYRSTAVRSHSEYSTLDARDFARSSDTLYICASSSSQRLLAPLVVGMLTHISEEIFQTDRPLPPCLFALDELANIAPLPDLPRLVSEGAGQGLLILGCLQDLSQARQRWGSIADGFLSLFSTTVVLPGVADRSTLELLEVIGGDHEVVSRSISQTLGRTQGMSVTDSTSRQARFPASLTAQGHRDQALFIDATKQLGWVGLSPAWRDEPWKSLIADRARLRSPYGQDDYLDRDDFSSRAREQTASIAPRHRDR